MKRKQRKIIIKCIIAMINGSAGFACKETRSLDLVGFSFLSHHSVFVNTLMLQ